MSGEALHRFRQISPPVRYGILLALILLILYALLHNGKWTPSSDPEVYLSAARNILLGDGYTFNGNNLGHYPPGWSVFLAGLMTVSTSFHFINGVAKLLIIAGALIYYALLLRYTSPVRAFVCVLLSATLWQWFRYGSVLMSESLFILLTALGLLMAIRISEGKDRICGPVCLILLCISLPAIRWAGLIVAGVMAMTAVSGEWKPKANRKWLTFSLCLIMGIASFGGFYWATQKGLFAPAERASDAGTDAPVRDDEIRIVAKKHGSTDARKVHRIKQLPLLDLRRGMWHARQIIEAPRLYALLLWPLGELGRKQRSVAMVFDVLGYILFIPIALATWRHVRKMHWVWLAVLLYVLMIMAIHSPRGRYLAAFAPFVILGVWEGLVLLRAWLRSRMGGRTRRLIGMFPPAFIALLAASNLFIYGMDVYVRRSPDFYHAFRAGQYRELLDAANHIHKHAPADARIGVSMRRKNLGKTHASFSPIAALVLLTNRRVVAAPRFEWKEDRDYLKSVAWAEEKGLDYVVVRPPTSPWRVWHFRVEWLQRRMTGQSEIKHYPYWECYRITEGRATLLQPPRAEDFPDHVPMPPDWRGRRQANAQRALDPWAGSGDGRERL